MIADSERREVARRLRHAWVNVPDTNRVRHHLRVLCEIYEAIGVSGDRRDAIDLFDRLADLIEPSCDRDALLALADDIDKQTDGSMFDAWLEDGHYIARRIREACVEEA